MDIAALDEVPPDGRILVTGGAGFIGSAVARLLSLRNDLHVLVVDKLTYAGSTDALPERGHGKFAFIQADICDSALIEQIVRDFRPTGIVHLAAETHVDRSIDDPDPFLIANVLGTGRLLRVACDYWRALPLQARDSFRFLQVSTDEVYGDAAGSPTSDCEHTAYSPSSPYAATKAGSDHLVRAWHRTYGLPTLISQSTNNYGPFQNPEKLIPHTILSALAGRPLPVYGDGKQSRQWIYVDDHAEALIRILTRGRVGTTYGVSSNCRLSNLEVVTQICTILDRLSPSRNSGETYADLISFVEDRPGHDSAYVLDATRTERELGWHPRRDFETGLTSTVQWYLDNPDWCERMLASGPGLTRLGQPAVTL